MSLLNPLFVCMSRTLMSFLCGRCALGWVQLEAVDSVNIFESRMVSIAFKALESTEACDEACDLLTHVMEAFVEPGVIEVIIPHTFFEGKRSPFSRIC